MGACASVPDQVADIPKVKMTGVEAAVVEEKIGSHTKIMNEKCPRIRLDLLKHARMVEIGSNEYSGNAPYVYVSQRGYYPNDMDKANQDSYLACENILGDKRCHAFGVFDGHGEAGDLCSWFAADKFPHFLEGELKARGGTSALNDENQMREIYKKTLVRTNKAMHKSREVDDVLSGTTAVTVVVKDGMLFVGNVGDSRAIIASEDQKGKLKYAPLSQDQTPYRKDERERLKQRGAYIMTLDQIQGNEELHENWGVNLGEELDDAGDPPRVWDSTLQRPGCAFTRSLGDQMAEEVGVYAEPEVLVWPITPNDRYVVIASDGVFEFITSQTVIDMIENSPNKLEGAMKVVNEAYTLWLTYDERTDDITIIVVDLENLSATSDSAAEALIQRASNSPRAAMADGGARPVRRGMSKAKRAQITETFEKSAEDEIPFDFAANTTAKVA